MGGHYGLGNSSRDCKAGNDDRFQASALRPLEIRVAEFELTSHSSNLNVMEFFVFQTGKFDEPEEVCRVLNG